MGSHFGTRMSSLQRADWMRGVWQKMDVGKRMKMHEPKDEWKTKSAPIQSKYSKDYLGDHGIPDENIRFDDFGG